MLRHRVKRFVQLSPLIRIPKRFSLRVAATKRYMEKTGCSLSRAWKHSGMVF